MSSESASYADQTRHYFDRPHSGRPVGPIRSPAAWSGSEIAADPAWRVALRTEWIDEIERALDRVEAEGRPAAELSAADLPLPALAPEIARWRRALTHGRGFLLVTGVPVERWSRERAETFFWCLGHHMGRPGAQNVQGDLLGHVVDTGADRDDPYVRLYRTAADIAYHCDAADVVGLLCLEPAASGGASRIVSSVRVYNELVSSRPDLAARLFEPFLLDLRNEDASGRLRALPIPACRHAEGVLRTFYHSDYFRSVERHEDVELDPVTRETMDVYEAIAARPDLRLDTQLERGAIQWLSNHLILHARTAYEDAPGRPRHLLRLWLSVDASEA